MDNDCYICTDPTTELSPCECKIPVHMTCLLKWIEKNDNKRLVCSVCNKKLHGIAIKNKKRSSLRTDTTPRPIGRTERQCLVFTIIFIRFLYWLVMGYLGKYIIAQTMEPELINDPDYWTPFDFAFLFCATVGCFITGLLINLKLKILKYLRTNNTGQYEEFASSDSDNGSNDGSAV